jgi:TRAP-type mannitol/chloroaromatic compound transport system substrate-binding protein
MRANSSAHGATWRSAYTRLLIITITLDFMSPALTTRSASTRGIWQGLAASDRKIFEAVAASECAQSLAEFNAKNALALNKLRAEGEVKILKFDDPLLKTFLAISNDVVADIGSGDELSRKIYASYQQFHTAIKQWSDIAVHAFLKSRSLA